ncbi:MAG: hypothetical protein JWO86_7717 [Myxococcaceae bacterium]|nr:hypothetical protein [Myxococcaceae bacterium]
MKYSSATFALVTSSAALAGVVLVATPGCTETTIVQAAPTAAADASDPDAGNEDAAPVERPTTRVAGKSAALFGSKAASYADVDDETGVVVRVGYTVPVKAFADAPANAPFKDDLVLEMPKAAQDQTMLHHVRVNWLTAGHGPDPYGEPHFDMHFQRGTLAEVDAIDCKADMRMPPPSALPAGYGAPELCVNAMGMHSWPKADKGTAWTGSIIMGFWATKVSFIEPMISKAKLLAKETFELTIGKPASAGGAHTLYPRRMTAKYDAAAATYAFELDQLEPID